MENQYQDVIRDLLQAYVFDIGENGEPKKSIGELMEIIERAKKLIEN